MTDQMRKIGGKISLELDPAIVGKLKDDLSSIQGAFDHLGEGFHAVGDKVLESTKSFSEGIKGIKEGVETFLGPLETANKFIESTFMPSIRSYTQTVGMNTEAGIAWREEQNAEAAQTNRIGESLMPAMLPAMQASTELMKNVADFLAANPELVAGVGKLAGDMAPVLAIGGAAASVLAVVAKMADMFGNMEKMLLGSPILKGILGKAGGAAAQAAGEAAGYGEAGGLIGPAAAPAAGEVAAAGGATVLGVVASAVGGLFAGGFVNDQINKATGGQGFLGIGKVNTAQAATAGAYEVGSIFGPETAQKWGEAVGKLTGAFDDGTKKALELKEAEEGDTQAKENAIKTLQDNQDFQSGLTVYKGAQIAQQNADLQHTEQMKVQQETRNHTLEVNEEQHNYQLETAADAHNLQLERTEESHQHQMEQQVVQWEHSDGVAADQRQYSRQKSLEEYQYQRGLAEKEFQRSQMLVGRDHQLQMQDLANDQDAMGLARSQRTFDIQQKKTLENHDYQLGLQETAHQRQLKLQDEDIAHQLEIQKQEREYQRAYAEQERQYQLGVQKKQYDENLEIQDTQYKHQLQVQEDANTYSIKLSEESYKRGNDIREKSLEDQLENLGIFVNKEAQTRHDSYVAMLSDFTTLVTNARMGLGFQVLPGQDLTQPLINPNQAHDDLVAHLGGITAQHGNGVAEGGYRDFGMYTMGEKGYEFTADHDTTTSLEKALGPLNQSSLKALAAGGGMGGGKNITLTQQFSFSGSFSDSEKAWFEKTAYDKAYEALQTAMESYQ